MEGQKTQNSQHNIEGEEQMWRIDKTRLQNYYKAAIINPGAKLLSFQTKINFLSNFLYRAQ